MSPKIIGNFLLLCSMHVDLVFIVPCLVPRRGPRSPRASRSPQPSLPAPLGCTSGGLSLPPEPLRGDQNLFEVLQESLKPTILPDIMI